ncbi:MAG: hypothetical protein JXR83_09535 [Deltaproteobacteria bacterium]|nr:hypothetical protein [Deltaproteobacteria bacterium]
MPESQTATVTLTNQDGCLRAPDQPDAPCLANPQGCSSISIETDASSGQTCEICYGENGDVISQHCGRAETASCSRLEDQLGNTCTICQAPDGSVVYDSCHAVERAVENCESYVGSDDQQCEICYDANGDVVSRDCAPAGYVCEEVVEGNQVCRRCYDQGGLVTETCSGAGGDPSSCTIIDDQNGYQCYICSDADGTIVDHNCSSNTAIRCETYYSSDNTLCEICYDDHGAVSSQSCTPAPVEETCREYRTESSICVICTDANNNITRRECYLPCSGTDVGQQCDADNACSGGTVCVEGFCVCPQAPSCELFTTEDGVLCEICGDLNGDGMVNELDANCFENPTDPVQCWEEERLDNEGNTVVCRICESETMGRTEECSRELTTQVTCEVVENSTGQICEVCRDASGLVVYTSCSDVACTWDATVQPIGNATSNTEPVECQICMQGQQLASMACDMDAVCSQSAGVAPPQDPTVSTAVDSCGNTWVSIEPRQCASNPWQIWWQEQYPAEPLPEATREGELIRAYYAATQQPPIRILAYRIEHAYETDTCTGCDCLRGDIIYLYVSAADAERLLRLGWRQAQ